MTVNITHVRSCLDRDHDGTVLAGSSVAHGYYAEFYGRDGELLDEAGPFDEYLDAHDAAERGLRWANDRL